jgi:hypothetical protein
MAESSNPLVAFSDHVAQLVERPLILASSPHASDFIPRRMSLV